MWEVFQIWIGQGIQHILDLDAYDHLLYLIALSIPFAVHGKYKTLGIQITAFTLGHTLALVIAANLYLPFPKIWVEFGILISILLTALYSIGFSSKNQPSLLHYVLTLGVGCIHGLGFGSFFSQMHPDKGREFLSSLIGFNLGVEIGQLIIVVGVIFFFKLLSYGSIKHSQMSKFLNIGIALISLYLLYELIFLE